jgi:hypothetical protein
MGRIGAGVRLFSCKAVSVRSSHFDQPSFWHVGSFVAFSSAAVVACGFVRRVFISRRFGVWLEKTRRARFTRWLVGRIVNPSRTLSVVLHRMASGFLEGAKRLTLR